MSKAVYIMFADGFEQAEAVIPVDFLRRAGLDVLTIGIDTKEVTSSHNLSLICDTTLNELAISNQAEIPLPHCIVLPGGPGAKNFANHAGLNDLLQKQHQAQGLVAAICASPVVVLSPLGILANKKYTCFDGMQEHCSDSSATFVDQAVVRDGQLITSRAVGTAAAFSIVLVALLSGVETAQKVWKATMQDICSAFSFNELMNLAGVNSR